MMGVAKHDGEKEIEGRRKVHEGSEQTGDSLCYGGSGSVVQVVRPESKHFPNTSDGMAV